MDARIGFLIKRPQKQTYPQIYVKSAPPLNASTNSNTQNYATVADQRDRKEDLSSLQRVAGHMSPDSCERNRDDGVITYGRIIQPRADGAMRRVRIKRAQTVTLWRRGKINDSRLREHSLHPAE